MKTPHYIIYPILINIYKIDFFLYNIKMVKQDIYSWLFNMGFKNGLNRKQAMAFARNYTEDKTALKDMKRRFRINVLKEDFERTTINSLQLQSLLKSDNDNSFKNFKSTYCCSNFYNGNKKKCDICKRDLKF